MTVINTAITPMAQIIIFGVPALFVPERISRDTVHLGLHCYELQAGGSVPFAILDRTDEGFFGTVLTAFPLSVPEESYREIHPGDFLNGGREHLTPAQFEEKYRQFGVYPHGTEV